MCVCVCVGGGGGGGAESKVVLLLLYSGSRVCRENLGQGYDPSLVPPQEHELLRLSYRCFYTKECQTLLRK